MKRILLLGAAIAAMGASALGAGTPAVKPWGVELSYIDKSVKPGDDFFLYANGNWVKTSKIPADRTYAGVNLELDLQNDAKLKSLVDTLAKTPDDKLTPEGRKLRDDTLRVQVLSNEHAPGKFRVISATRNTDAWYDAFGAKPGDKYYLAPDQRVRLW